MGRVLPKKSVQAGTWEKIVALMDREFGPVLRGSRPATSLTGLSHDVDEVLRIP